MNESHVAVTDREKIEGCYKLLGDAIMSLSEAIDKLEADMMDALSCGPEEASDNADRRIDLRDLLTEGKAFFLLYGLASGGTLTLTVSDARLIARILDFQ